MDVDTAYAHLRSNLDIDVGSFYSDGADLSLGAGMLYKGVRIPLYHKEKAIFQTALASVYVLTHECDVDQRNQREFNDYALVCPLIPLENFVAIYGEEWEDEKLLGFLSNLARRNISRVLYIPPFSEHRYGALMYLNQITSTHVSALGHNDANLMAAVTTRGLRIIDYFIENHFLRPKSERLGLSY